MKKKWRVFCESVPTTGSNATQDLTITDVAAARKVGAKTCLLVQGETADGKEHNRVFIPFDADLEYNPDTFTLSGGRMSATGHSYTQEGYDWEIEAADDTMQPIKNVAELIKA